MSTVEVFYDLKQEDAALCNYCNIDITGDNGEHADYYLQQAFQETDKDLQDKLLDHALAGSHSGTHYIGWCYYCASEFDYIQDHFSRPNCSDIVNKSCSCGKMTAMVKNGKGVYLLRTCSVCGLKL